MQKPRRAVRVSINIDGHTRQDVVDALRELAEDIELPDSCGGDRCSPRVNRTCRMEVDAAQTPERFKEQLYEYVRSIKIEHGIQE